jgi:hypothetical protein
MEYLNWFAEHPWLGILLLWAIVGAAHGFGGWRR